MRKTVLYLSLATLLFASCETSQQASGLFTGSMLGGIFGSSIGGLMEGPRGADAGRAIGMVIGGAAGVAATTPRSSKVDKNRGETYGTVDRTDQYNRRRSSSSASTIVSVPGGYDGLEIEGLRFVDLNNNQALDAQERAKLVFEIRNNGSQTLRNIAPVVEVSDNKRIMVSPTAIVDAIPAGKAVRYTAELFGKKNLRDGVAQFSIGFAYGNRIYTVRRFELRTSANRR